MTPFSIVLAAFTPFLSIVCFARLGQTADVKKMMTVTLQKNTDMEIEYRNLRKIDDNLVAAGTPVVDRAFAGWTPVGRINGLILAYKRDLIALNDPDNAIGLGKTILSVTRLSDSEFIFMTLPQAYLVTAQDDYLNVQPMKYDFPDVGLSAQKETSLTVTVPARQLSANYSSGPLKNSDEIALRADLTTAYRRLCANAAATGVAIQPALARYRLLDADGRAIFAGQPMLLAPEGGAQCADYVPLYLPDGNTVSEYSLTAAAWRLKVSLPADAAAAKRVARLEVMMTPVFHPFDTSLPAPVQYARRASANDVFARIALPGRQRGLGSSFAGNSRRILARALARLESMENPVATVNSPFDRAQEFTFDVPCSETPEQDADRILAGLDKKVVATPRDMAYISMPNSFSARISAAGASTCMWGGIAALPFEGYLPESFAAGTRTETAWEASAFVRFADGRGVARHSGASTGAFTALTPIICYPSPGAVEITINLLAGNTSRSITLPLTTDESGRFSYYIAPGLQSIDLPVAKATAPQFRGSRLDLPGMIAIAEAKAPTDIKITARIPGELTAALAATGSDQSWEFGRSRFIAATASKILSVAVAKEFKGVSIKVIADNGIARADGICTDGKGGFFAIATEAGAPTGRIIRFDSRGAISVLDNSEEYLAVGYSTGHDELIAMRRNDVSLVFDGGTTKFVASRDTFDADRLVMAEGELFGMNSEGLILFVHETRSSTDIEARRTIVPRGYGHSNARSVRADMQASEFDGIICVEGLNAGPMRPWDVRTFAVRGSVAGPVRMRVLSRPFRVLRVRIAGTASPDLRIKGHVAVIDG